jgi:hypothetical protein
MAASPKTAMTGQPAQKIRVVKVVIVPSPGCAIVPSGEIHAPKQSQEGVVNFFATDPCTINFGDATVFNGSFLDLDKGDNLVEIQCENGKTSVSIQGCASAAKGSRTKTRMTTRMYSRAAGDPTDIIVP